MSVPFLNFRHFCFPKGEKQNLRTSSVSDRNKHSITKEQNTKILTLVKHTLANHPTLH